MRQGRLRALARARSRASARLLWACGRLRRTRVGPFHAEAGVGFAELERGPEALKSALLGVEAGLSELARVVIDRNGAATLRRGQRLLLRGSAAPSEGTAYTVCFGKPVAVGIVENGEFVSTRVFNLD